MREPDCRARKFASVCRQVCFLFLAFALCGLAHGQTIGGGQRLFLLASKVDEPVVGRPTNTDLFSVSGDGQLHEEAVVLEGKVSSGSRLELPEGVYSVHEVGPYLLVEYPHDVPCCVIFLAKGSPRDFQSINFDPEGLGVVSHSLTERPDGAVCVLWLQLLGPPSASGGQVAVFRTMLRSVCKKPGEPPFLEKDQWMEYKYPNLDGFVRTDEVWDLSDVNGKIVEMMLDRSTVEIADMPTDIPDPSRDRGVSLKAASARYLVVSVLGADGFERNADVFAQTRSNGGWKRLPVHPVRTTQSDQMLYRLFDDWLVTSASASLLANLLAKETNVPEALTVVAQGKQRDQFVIHAEPRTAPDVATLPARRITLWNLADGRRIDLAIPEDDSEIVHVFDGHRVLLRIKDSLFFAEIEGSKLVNYRLVAHDSAIPQVHWAFYSTAK